MVSGSSALRAGAEPNSEAGTAVAEVRRSPLVGGEMAIYDAIICVTLPIRYVGNVMRKD